MTRQALSEHFTIEEFDCHDGTKVPAAAVDELQRLCRRWLEPLRARFGRVIVHSGYRTPQYNASVGGARSSYHIYTITHRYGVAADVECANGGPVQWHAFLRDLRARQHQGRGGLGLYVRGGFVHVDNRSYQADWIGP